MSMRALRPLIGLLAVAAIATVVLAQQQEEGPPEARAQLIDQQGNLVGEATFTTEDDAVRIRIQVRGLTAALEGERGLHIHELGSCEPPDFESAGDHFNPTGGEHGLLHPDGPHAGDLPNMVFDADGNADFEVLTMRVTLGEGEHSLLGGDGRTVVIHINPDDYVEGNTEDRIACGVIEAVAHGPGDPGGEELPGEPGDEEYEVPGEPGEPGEEMPGEPGEEELPGEPGDEEYEVPGEPGDEVPGEPGEEMPGEPGEEELPGEPGG